MMKIRKSWLGLPILLTVVVTFCSVANAQAVVPQSSMQRTLHEQKPNRSVTTASKKFAVFLISDQQAQAETTSIRIFPGRSSVIDLRNGEVITYIQLANSERIVYHTNAPVESGNARLIALRLSQPYPFNGQTRPPGFGQRSSSATNLIVNTVNKFGYHNSYIFDLIPATGIPGPKDRNGVAIVAQSTLKPLTITSISEPTVQTNLGQATISDIERGLRVSLDKKYSAPNDPIIFQVKECLALARNGVPLLEAVTRMNIPVSVITSLGQIGIADNIINGVQFRRMNQINNQPFTTNK